MNPLRSITHRSIAASCLVAVTIIFPCVTRPASAQTRDRVAPVSWVRVINAAPDIEDGAPVSINGSSVPAPPYREATPLVAVVPEAWNVAIGEEQLSLQAPAPTALDVWTVIMLPRQSGGRTVTAIKTVLPDLTDGQSAVRVVNAAPDAGPVDPTVGTDPLATLPVGSSSEYHVVAAGTVTVSVSAGGPISQLDVDAVARSATTVVLLGAEDRPVHLEQLVDTDGTPAVAVGPSEAPTNPAHVAGEPRPAPNAAGWLGAGAVVAGLVLMTLFSRRSRPIRRSLVRSACSMTIVSLVALVGTLAGCGSSARGAGTSSPTSSHISSNPTGTIAPTGVTTGEDGEAIPAPGGTEPTTLTDIEVANGLRSMVVATDVDQDGLLMVPTVTGVDATGATRTQAGWFAAGPLPGEPGNAVVIAHRNYGGVRGGFDQLEAVGLGSVVRVWFTGGREADFRVVRVRNVLKADFPLREVYSPTEVPQLQLVTCGGPIGRGPDGRRHYRDNVIVTAVPERFVTTADGVGWDL